MSEVAVAMGRMLIVLSKEEPNMRDIVIFVLAGAIAGLADVFLKEGIIRFLLGIFPEVSTGIVSFLVTVLLMSASYVLSSLIVKGICELWNRTVYK